MVKFAYHDNGTPERLPQFISVSCVPMVGEKIYPLQTNLDSISDTYYVVMERTWYFSKDEDMPTICVLMVEECFTGEGDEGLYGQGG